MVTVYTLKSASFSVSPNQINPNNNQPQQGDSYEAATKTGQFETGNACLSVDVDQFHNLYLDYDNWFYNDVVLQIGPTQMTVESSQIKDSPHHSIEKRGCGLI